MTPYFANFFVSHCNAERDQLQTFVGTISTKQSLPMTHLILLILLWDLFISNSTTSCTWHRKRVYRAGTFYFWVTEIWHRQTAIFWFRRSHLWQVCKYVYWYLVGNESSIINSTFEDHMAIDYHWLGHILYLSFVKLGDSDLEPVWV